MIERNSPHREPAQGLHLPPRPTDPHSTLAHKLESLVNLLITIPEAHEALRRVLESFGGIETLRERLRALGAVRSCDSQDELLRLNETVREVAQEHLWKAHLLELPWAPHLGTAELTHSDTRAILSSAIGDPTGKPVSAIYDLSSQRGFKIDGRLDKVYISPDGQQAFANMRSDTFHRPHLIDLNTGEITLVPYLHHSDTESIKFCERTGAAYAKVVVRHGRHILDLKSGELLRVPGYNTEDSNYPSLSPDGTEMWAPFKLKGKWHFVELRSKKIIPIGGSQLISNVGPAQFSGDGRLVYSSLIYPTSSSICNVRTGELLTVNGAPINYSSEPFFLSNPTEGFAWASTRQGAHLLRLAAEGSHLIPTGDERTRIEWVDAPEISPNRERAYCRVRGAPGVHQIVDVTRGCFAPLGERLPKHISPSVIYFGADQTPLTWIEFESGWELVDLLTGRGVPPPGGQATDASAIGITRNTSHELLSWIRHVDRSQSIVKFANGNLETIYTADPDSQVHIFSAPYGGVYAIEKIRQGASQIVDMRSGERVTLRLSNWSPARSWFPLLTPTPSLATWAEPEPGRPEALLEVFGNSFAEQKASGKPWTFQEVLRPKLP